MTFGHLISVWLLQYWQRSQQLLIGTSISFRIFCQNYFYNSLLYGFVNYFRSFRFLIRVFKDRCVWPIKHALPSEIKKSIMESHNSKTTSKNIYIDIYAFIPAAGHVRLNFFLFRVLLRISGADGGNEPSHCNVCLKTNTNEKMLSVPSVYWRDGRVTNFNFRFLSLCLSLSFTL